MDKHTPSHQPHPPPYHPPHPSPHVPQYPRRASRRTQHTQTHSLTPHPQRPIFLMSPTLYSPVLRCISSTSPASYLYFSMSLKPPQTALSEVDDILLSVSVRGTCICRVALLPIVSTDLDLSQYIPARCVASSPIFFALRSSRHPHFHFFQSLAFTCNILYTIPPCVFSWKGLYSSCTVNNLPAFVPLLVTATTLPRQYVLLYGI